MKTKREAIALLITVMFVIVMSVAMGFGLQKVNSASEILKKEQFLYQSSMIVEDVLEILKNSPDIKSVADTNSSAALYTLLSQAAFIPFEIDGLEIIMQLSSARARIAPEQLLQNPEAFRLYLNNHNINSQFFELLNDITGGIKEDNSYNSRIFDTKVELFRDYLASKEHLRYLEEFYAQEYGENALALSDIDKLLYYGQESNSSVDLNYASAPLWELLLGSTKERAEELEATAGLYESFEELNLNDAELESLRKFKVSFFEPIIAVHLTLREGELYSSIYFEYDIKKGRGSHFVYEI